MRFFIHSGKATQPSAAQPVATGNGGRRTDNRERETGNALPTPLQLRAAYAVCRSISRAAARNFYYSFLALPQDKRDALCAVYAFMRHADDISDEPAVPAPNKRARLEAWLDSFRAVLAGKPTDDPVLMALADTQYRFAIPPALLEMLVEGTAMDLEDDNTLPPRHPEPSEGSAFRSPDDPITRSPERLTTPYATFDDLYRYCYRVASVVGLVCIKIFGYRDPAAEPLAERVGIAFQLTNIIRDVKEDAALGRVYLPREDLARFGCNPASLSDGLAEAAAHFRPVLEFEARRAREFYAAADELLPLIDEQSRPALWVLVEIYRRLLDKIALRNYDVFGDKIRLTAAEKLAVLARGFWRRLT